jgi:hypothetical protein
VSIGGRTRLGSPAKVLGPRSCTDTDRYAAKADLELRLRGGTGNGADERCTMDTELAVLAPRGEREC